MSRFSILIPSLLASAAVAFGQSSDRTAHDQEVISRLLILIVNREASDETRSRACEALSAMKRTEERFDSSGVAQFLGHMWQARKEKYHATSMRDVIELGVKEQEQWTRAIAALGIVARDTDSGVELLAKIASIEFVSSEGKKEGTTKCEPVPPDAGGKETKVALTHDPNLAACKALGDIGTTESLAALTRIASVSRSEPVRMNVVQGLVTMREHPKPMGEMASAQLKVIAKTDECETVRVLASKHLK